MEGSSNGCKAEARGFMDVSILHSVWQFVKHIGCALFPVFKQPTWDLQSCNFRSCFPNFSLGSCWNCFGWVSFYKSLHIHIFGLCTFRGAACQCGSFWEIPEAKLGYTKKLSLCCSDMGLSYIPGPGYNRRVRYKNPLLLMRWLADLCVLWVGRTLDYRTGVIQSHRERVSLLADFYDCL